MTLSYFRVGIIWVSQISHGGVVVVCILMLGANVPASRFESEFRFGVIIVWFLVDVAALVFATIWLHLVFPQHKISVALFLA